MPSPLINSPALTAGEPNLPEVPTVNAAKSGFQKNTSTARPKVVKVKAHTRVVKPKAAKPSAPAAPQPAADPYAVPVNAAIQMKYGPLIQGDQAQIQQSVGNQLRMANWYQRAQQQAQAQVQAQQQAAANLAGQLNAQREALPAGASPEAAQAAASRGVVGQAFGAQMGLIGQNQAAYLAGLGAAQGLAGQQSQGVEASRQGQLTDKLAQDRSAEGAYGTVVRGQLQAADAKAQADAAKTQAAIAIAGGKLDLARQILTNVTVPKTQAQITQGQQKIKLTASKQRAANNQQKVKNAQWANQQALKAYQLAHPGLKTKGGSGGFTNTQVQKAASTFRTTAGQMNQQAVMKDPYGAIQALIHGGVSGKHPMDPIVANAVVESIVNHGSVTRDTATAYFRATGHHLHVSPQAKHISKSIGQIFQTILQNVSQGQ